MRVLKSGSVAVIIVLVMVVGIGVARVSGLWNTQSTRVPARFSAGEFSGSYNPADIRGSYSFADIETAFGVPATILAEAFGVGDVADAGSVRANSLEAIYVIQPDGGEVGADSLRLFTAWYTGLPYSPEPTTRLPGPAIAVLEPRLAPADADALRAIAVSLADLRGGAAQVTPDMAARAEPADATSAEHDEDARIVKGNTTFNDLLDWGLSEDQIEEALGMPMGTRAMTVRDHVVGQGGEFSTIRFGLQELLD